MFARWMAIGFLISGSLAAAELRQFQPAGPEGPTDDEVNAIARKLYCPVCPNTPLDVCETQACQDWRAQIKRQLAAGWEEREIIEYFVAQYGERVLAEPRARGFTALVWVLPVIAVAGAGIALRRVLISWKLDRELPLGPEAPLPDLPSDVLARIDAELDELA